MSIIRKAANRSSLSWWTYNPGQGSLQTRSPLSINGQMHFPNFRKFTLKNTPTKPKSCSSTWVSFVRQLIVLLCPGEPMMSNFAADKSQMSSLRVGSIPIYGFELWRQTITRLRQNPMSIELLVWTSTIDIVPLFIANLRMHVRIAGDLTTGGRHASS